MRKIEVYANEKDDIILKYKNLAFTLILKNNLYNLNNENPILDIGISSFGIYGAFGDNINTNYTHHIQIYNLISEKFETQIDSHSRIKNFQFISGLNLEANLICEEEQNQLIKNIVKGKTRNNPHIQRLNETHQIPNKRLTHTMGKEQTLKLLKYQSSLKYQKLLELIEKEDKIIII